MNIDLMQQSLKDACELLRLAGNNVFYLETNPDEARFHLTDALLAQLLKCLDTARGELRMGRAEGKVFLEENELAFFVTVSAFELVSRYDMSARAWGASRRPAVTVLMKASTAKN